MEAIDVGKTGMGLLAAGVLLFQLTGPAGSQSLREDPSLITATGIGHPPPDAVSAAQAKGLAERAALLQALNEAARKAGRQAPQHVGGSIRVGATIQGFRVMRITPLSDGSIEVEVSVPPAGVTP